MFSSSGTVYGSVRHACGEMDLGHLPISLYGASKMAGLAFGSTLLLIPMIAFFNLWSNWGATLYGEVRGASDFKKNIGAMAGALIVTTILAVVFLLLIAHTMGWNFYNSANNAWWSVTAWQERRLMQSYVRTEPHRNIQSHLDRYCDEATFVDWEQDSPDLPDWPTNWRHLIADGQAAELTQPSAAHQTRDFPAPVVAPPAG